MTTACFNLTITHTSSLVSEPAIRLHLQNIAMIHKLFTTLFFTACMLPTVFGQTGDVLGKVVDGRNGETIIGASVTIDVDPNLGTVTDVDGGFNISKVPVGKHQVKVRYIGFREKIDELNVVENNVTNV